MPAAAPGVCRRVALLFVVALTVASSGGVARSGTALAQATPGAAATPEALATIEIIGVVAHPGPVSVADLQHFQPETIEVSYTSDDGSGMGTHTFTGVRLFDVLSAAGLPASPDDGDLPLVRMYVVLSARDGYQIVLSLGELAPDLGDAPILLAWERDGAPLPAMEAPLQLVVPGDETEDRYIWAIETIDVRDVE